MTESAFRSDPGADGAVAGGATTRRGWTLLVPLRVLVAPVVGRDDDDVGPGVKVGDLRVADLSGLGPRRLQQST
jgi:hypothetical protein